MSEPQSREEDSEQPHDEVVAQGDEADLTETDAEETPANEENSGASHWKSLIEEIGAQVAPGAAAPRQPQPAAAEPQARPSKQEKKKAPRTSQQAPGRQHWAGLAGDLGIEFPDPPPPEPEAAESDVAEPKETRATEEVQREPEPTPKPAKARREDRSDGRGTVVTVVPENLIEDMPAAVSSMLDDRRQSSLGFTRG